MALRDQGGRVSELRQHFQAATSDLQPSFRGLIGIRDAADPQNLRPPARRRELRPQQLRRIFFDEDLRLEVQPRRESQVLVIGSRVAVDAAVLAPPVRVEAGVEANVGAAVARDQRTRRVPQQARLWRRVVGVPPAVALDCQRLEAIGRVVHRAPTTEGQCIHRSCKIHFRGLFGKEELDSRVGTFST